MIRSTTPTASAVDSPCDAQSCDSRLSLPRRRLISAAGSIALGSSLPFSAYNTKALSPQTTPLSDLPVARKATTNSAKK